MHGLYEIGMGMKDEDPLQTLGPLWSYSNGNAGLGCTRPSQSFPLWKDCGYERSLEKEGKDDKKDSKVKE